MGAPMTHSTHRRQTVTCSDCRHQDTASNVTQYSDGWSCSTCNYFNANQHAKATSTAQNTSRKPRTDTLPDEIERLVKILTLTLIGYASITTFTSIHISTALLTGVILVEVLFGVSEYAFVALTMTDEQRETYRAQRKQNIQKGVNGITEVLSITILFTLILTIFHVIDTALL